MSVPDLVAARRRAEEAVADMSDGPLKLKAFEVILGSLLSGQPRQGVDESDAARSSETRRDAPSSLAERIELLAAEGFLSEPRSLSDIQTKLAEHGWHYPQTNLSTPLIRLVRQRRLRRLSVVAGNKRVWKYTLP